MRHDATRSDMQGGLSWFLVAYLLLILGVLLGVHVMQTGWGHPDGASRLPVKQPATAARQALPT